MATDLRRWDRAHRAKIDFLPLNELLLRRLLKRIVYWTGRTPKTALDLGCGDGGDLVRLAAQGLQVTGVDGSVVAVRRSRAALKASGLPARVRHADLNRFTSRAHYDLVLCKLTIAFLENRPAFLRRVRGMLTSHGVLILITPVLHPGVRYALADKPGIAVPYDAMVKELHDIFGRVRILHEWFPGERRHVVIWGASR